MRINLFGGPGTGKSTLAAGVFTKLRQHGTSCALVTEWLKIWAYEGRVVHDFDQVFSFANQLHLEKELLLYTGMIISDSPLFLQCMYADQHAKLVANDLWNIARTYESQYPSINFYVERMGPYEQHGRYEDKKRALNMDDYIQAQLIANDITTIHIQRTDIDLIIEELHKVL